MEKRLMIALLGLVALTTALEETKDCHACFGGVCYELNKLDGDRDRFLIDKLFTIDRVDNLVYISYPHEIKSLNLTDKTTKTVVTVEDDVLGLAVNQASRDLYYSLRNGDFYKYNLVTNQKASLLKPASNESETRPKFNNLFFISDKLYAVGPSDFEEVVFSLPALYEYVPEESQFKVFAPLKDVELLEEPFADGRGNIYFKNVQRLFKLRAGIAITLVSSGNALQDGVGRITAYGADKDGVAYFVPEFGQKLYKLTPYSNKFRLVGGINSRIIKSINFDKYNNILYFDIGLRYLTATDVTCEVTPRGMFGIEIVKTDSVYD